jgi:serine/threonine protein kinase
MRSLIPFLYYSWQYARLAIQGYDYWVEWRRTGTHPPERLDSLLQTVHGCGAVASKFVQWLTPKFELMAIEESEFFQDSYEERKPRWLRALEKMYETCPEHSLDHTYREYQRVFRERLSDRYELLEVIGSGSLGQVYRLREHRTQKIYVLKILHPEIHDQISTFQWWVSVLSKIPWFQTYFQQTIFNVHDFIRDFQMQSNLLNEANHLMTFRQAYPDNPLIQIPELYQISSSILLMEYIPGTPFETSDLSFHRKSTLFAAFHMFVRSNAMFLNFNHGDLHPGNWKITPDHRLVIYDFGFCWSFPDALKDIVPLSIETLEGTSEDLKDETLDNITQMMVLLIEYKDAYDTDTIQREIWEYVKESPYIGKSDTGFVVSPVTILKLLNGFCLARHLKVVSHCVQFLILLTQMQKNSVIFRFSSPTGYCYPPTKVYKERYVDCLNICKTYNIFPEYTAYIQETLASLQMERTTIFETVEMPESIRQLALKFDLNRKDDTKQRLRSC